LFPRITVVLCLLHGFWKIRDRCRKARELHRRVWNEIAFDRNGHLLAIGSRVSLVSEPISQ
jgi:hypothetical protein